MTHIKDAKPEPLTAEQEVWHRRAALCENVPNRSIILACFAAIDVARRERDEARADQAMLDKVLAALGIADSHLDPGDYVEALQATLDAARAETEAVRDERDAARHELSVAHAELAQAEAGNEAVASLRALAAELVEGLALAKLRFEALAAYDNGMRNGARPSVGAADCETLIAKARAAGIGAPKGERLEITVETPAETARSYDGIRRALGLEPAPKGEKGEG
jgi:hypothetical protein